jgi:Flp pilus assembly pilin Flp
MTKFTKFLSDDAGAVTIDWVALTAGVLLLGIMVVYAIFNNGVSTLVSNVNSTLSGVTTNISIGSIDNFDP